MKATMEITGRNGALTTYRIEGADENLLESLPSGYTPRIDGTTITGKGSKKDIQKIEKAVAAYNYESAPEAKKTETKKTSGRYITLLLTADENELSHGKAWIADAYTVDKHSLNPAWEGERICYVYA